MKFPPLLILATTVFIVVDSYHEFNPLPGTIVCAHCRWEVKLDTMFNRIPSTITEVLCRNPNSTCGGGLNFQVELILGVICQ